MDVAVLDNHIAEINTDPEGDPLFLGGIRVALGHAALDAIAHATASTALGNSIRVPSPVVLTIRPPCSATFGSISSRR
jgi:hypothetical protein